jgi:hypothetical protein
MKRTATSARPVKENRTNDDGSGVTVTADPAPKSTLLESRKVQPVVAKLPSAKLGAEVGPEKI